MLFQNDPFRELDEVFGRMGSRASAAPAAMPMDAYRRDTDVWVHVDLPGVSADSIDVNVERHVLTITAQRDWARHEEDRVYLAERRRGTFTRQVHLGDGLDADGIEADYTDGVLTLRIPVAERAQPRKVAITTGQAAAIDVESSSSTD
jgi:HSP20 family protein